MKIIGLINWYNESPDDLYMCAISAYQLCDEIIAVDGRYEKFAPGMPAVSPRSNYKALEKASLDCKKPIAIHKRSTPWTDEMQKRSFGMKEIELITDENDWFMYLDADEELVIGRQGPDQIIKMLAHYTGEGKPVVTVMCQVFTPEGPREKSNNFDEGIVTCPRFFRTLRDLQVEHNHYLYTGTHGGVKYALHCLHLAQAFRLKPVLIASIDQGIIIIHNTLNRTEEREMTKQSYVKIRGEYGD